VIVHVPQPLASPSSQAPSTPVLLLSEGDCLVASGVSDTLAGPQDAIAALAAAFFARQRDQREAVLVGAFPFDSAHDAHLIAPQSLSRLPLWNLRAAAPAGGRGVRAMRSTPDANGYRARIATALDRMRNGELRKVVLSRRLSIEFTEPLDPLDVVTHLQLDRRVTTFCVPLHSDGGAPGRWLVGATPELLIAKRGSSIQSAPLAGSARRDSEPARDREAAEGLARSDKDRREHATVVEWIADRLQPYCRTLKVPATPEVASTATMWHLGTTINGELKDAATPSIELAAVLHPTPAVCGVPHGLATEAIADLEPFDRGFYGGAVGWSAANGDGRWMVAIRCAELAGSTAHLFAGAGIVSGSDPAAEFDETAAKFATLLNALGVDASAACREGGEP